MSMLDEKTRDKLAAIGDAEKLVDPTGVDDDAIRAKLVPIKTRYRLTTLDLVVDTKQELSETLHFTASASKAEVGKAVKVTTVKAGGKDEEFEATWTVDRFGRTIKVKATLRAVHKGAERSASEVSAQGASGKSGKTGDVGGHALGHRFVKDQGPVNMFPQNARFNNSAWKTMENEWAAAIKAGNHVRVEIELRGGTKDRPERVSVFYEFVDVDSGKAKYDKTANFKNDEFQKFDRLPTEAVGAL